MIDNVRRWRAEDPERYRETQRKYREVHGEEKKRRDREGHLRRKTESHRTCSRPSFLPNLDDAPCAVLARLRTSMSITITRPTRYAVSYSCNKAIGLLSDDPNLMLSAKMFLERSAAFWESSPSRSVSRR